jgi:hypothetical protein
MMQFTLNESGRYTRSTRCLLVLTALLAGLSAASAQYVAAPEEQEPLPARKNSLGLYITSPASVLMAANPYTFRAGLFYKHYLAPNKRLRLQAVVDFPDLYEDYDNELDHVIRVEDTTVTFFVKSDKDVFANVRMGFEWSRPNMTVAPVYGVDLIVGMRQSENRRSHYTYRRDTVPEIVPYFWEAPVVETRYGVQTRALLVGAALTVGWKVFIRDVLELQAHFSPEFYYMATFEEKILVPEGGGTLNSSSLYFRLRVIELTAHFRF